MFKNKVMRATRLALCTLGVLLMIPFSSYANDDERIDFMDIYCSEDCQWQAKECPVLLRSCRLWIER